MIKFTEGVQIEQNSYCPKSHYTHQHLIGSEHSQNQTQQPLQPEQQSIYSQQHQSVSFQQVPT